VAITAWELARLPRSVVLVRTALWLIVAFVVATIIQGTWFPRYPVELWDQLLVMSFVSFAFAMMPPALYLAAQGQVDGRHIPFLGLALVSILGMWIASEWVLPSAFQSFRETTGTLWGETIQPGPAERSLRELLAGSVSYGELKQASSRLATIVPCPAFVLLAAQGRLMGRWRRRALAIVLLIVYFGASRFAGIVGLTSQFELWDLFELWAAPAIALAGTFLLAIMRERQRNAEPGTS